MVAAGRGMDAPTVVAQILIASLDGCQGGIAAPGCFQRATPGMQLAPLNEIKAILVNCCISYISVMFSRGSRCGDVAVTS